MPSRAPGPLSGHDRRKRFDMIKTYTQATVVDLCLLNPPRVEK